MTNIQTPPGLLDENTELFSLHGEPMGLHSGKVKALFELPISIIDTIEADLADNPAAVMALELAGYTSRAEKIKKYTVCRFGSFDNDPDIKDGQLTASEYYDCGHRGTCAMEGIVCSSLRVNGRVLSPFETQMIKHLSTEETLPAVAELLQVSFTTFEVKKKVLYEKLGVATRAGMVGMAYKLNILQVAACSA
jgi:hypothetical protein